MRRMWILAAVAVLAVCASAQDWEQSFENADKEARARAAEAARLAEEVSLLNLINGLYLSRPQCEKVIALAREAGDLRDATIKKHAGLIADFQNALAKLREHLVSCGHIPPEVEQKVHESENAINQSKQAYFGSLRAVEKRLRAALTPAQIQVVEKFNPCLIPPKDLKDPVRVGQASSETAEIEEHIETLRNLPDKAWKPVAEALFEFCIAHEELVLGKFSPAKRRAEIERLTKITQKARDMSDRDFEMEKGALAKEVVKPIVDHEEKARELTTFYLNVSGGLTKVGKFLLNPHAVPLLEAKMKQASDTAPADLDKIQPAESCKTCGKGGDGKKSEIAQPGPEPKFGQLAAWLDLSEDQSSKARDAIANAQHDLLTMLAGERDDGRNVLSEFLKKLLARKEIEAFALLLLKDPQSGKTYGERINEIRKDAEASLRETVGGEKFEKFHASGIDLFKVKVGSLRWRK